MGTALFISIDDGDRLGIADRAALIIGLDSNAHCQFEPAFDIIDGEHRKACANVTARQDRGGETDLVASVINRPGHAVLPEEPLSLLGQKRDSQITMGDGCAERGAARGALTVSMNPLPVTGGIGEGVDPFLGDRNPVADEELGAHQVSYPMK